MAKIPGTNVASTIAPFTTDDQFPTHDAIYGKGGQREVATIADRDAIPAARLTEGCTCYVAATEKTYRWKSNAWVDDTPEIASDASDIDYTPSGSGSTPTTVAGALDSLNESVSGLEDSVQGNADDIADLEEGAVAVDVNTTTKVFAIKNAKGQDVGTITVSETTGLPVTLTLAKAGTNGQSITISLPTLTYNSQTQMLEYVDATGTHVPTIKLSNLQIKYVGSTDPSTGTWALGDLILVGSNSSYELKVYDGNSTWQPLGSINDVSLQAEQIHFTPNGGLSSTNVQSAIEEVNKKTTELGTHVREKIQNISFTSENGFYAVDANGNICLVVNNQGVFDVIEIGANIRSKIEAIISTNINVALETVNESLEDIDSQLESLSQQLLETRETEEDGVYYVDENGWIGCQYINGAWSFNNLTNAGSGGNEDASTDHALIMRTNKAIKELNAVKDQIDHSIPSLLTLTNGETQSTITTTIKNTSAKEKAIIRLRLHYGSSKYTSEENDIFFNGSCKTDFSDVRFFDSNGKMLKAAFGEAFHLGVYRDTNLNGGAHGRYVKVTSNGYLINLSGAGMVISKDNAQTWAPIGPNGSGYKGYSNNASDVYGFTGIIPVLIDSNDNLFGYAGGKLYKIASGVNYDYPSATEVCDFSWQYTDPSTSEVTTVYPDIAPAGMAEDINGNLYFGTYAKTKYYHVDVFVSTNQGNYGTWVKKYHKSETDLDATGDPQRDFQHVHHVHADKYSTKVYVGIDGGFPAQGPTLIYTDDAGETWNDITMRLKEHRGHDQYPSYFGQTYKLGGGESYTLGGNSIIRGNSNDTEFEDVWKGWGGIRFISDFGDDSLLIAGVQRNTHFEENQILLSYNQGKTWKNLMRVDTPHKVTSGDGFRVAKYCGTLAGDVAPCVILNQGHYVDAFRVYKETNDYYREVEIEVDNASASNITITAKTGYVMPYPYTTVRGIEVSGLVYEIPFNEGCGKMVQDSLGNIASVDGTISWETEEEPVRYGEYSSEDDKPFAFSSAAKINGVLDFGKLDILNFSNDYTLAFWWNEKNRLCNYDDEDRYDHDYLTNPEIMRVLSAGNYDLVRTREGAISFIPRGATNRNNMNGQSLGNYSLPCSNNYCFICLVVSSTRVTLYVNGAPSGVSDVGSWAGYNNMALSAANLVIGNEELKMPGYISNFRIYNRQLSDTEIRDIYKGFNYEPIPLLHG